MKMIIGILCIQGGITPFVEALHDLGYKTKMVQVPEDLEDIDGLVMPGGESSVQYKLLKSGNMLDAITKFASTGKPILGTCAGLILLSNYKSDLVKGLGLINVNVERNFFGRQINSGVYKSDSGNEFMFIRAPGIIEVGHGVTVLDTYQNQPIAVKQKNITGFSFHPELLKSTYHLIKTIFSN